jgi:alanine racemase
LHGLLEADTFSGCQNDTSVPNSLMRAWVEVDLGALRRNAATVARHTGAPLLPMVKADAYGLGAVRVARVLDAMHEVWGFGVATVREGEELRRSSITKPILVFTPLLARELDVAERLALTPALGDASAIARWITSRRPWHLAIDTGMHRAGVPWRDVASLDALLRESPPDGAFTHYHSAELDDGSLEAQEDRFRRAIAALPARPALLHAENSAAAARRSPTQWDLVRPGVFLYGVGSGARAGITPEPVASLRARIVETRSVPDGEGVSYDATWRASGMRRVATVPVGYADGYRRILGNRTDVVVRGRRAPVVGVVTMDMTMIDVTSCPCDVGDIVTLIGSDGAVSLDVESVAAHGELSPYELLTGLRQRLPRRYVEEETQ